MRSLSLTGARDWFDTMSAMPEQMPPELDLLEQCSAEDISLRLVLDVFSPDDPLNAKNIERVRRVVSIYAHEGFIVIKQHRENGEQAVEPWRVRHVLADAATWAETPDDEHRYLLSLTTAGWNAFVDRSQGFFDRLFGKSDRMNG